MNLIQEPQPKTWLGLVGYVILILCIFLFFQVFSSLLLIGIYKVIGHSLLGVDHGNINPTILSAVTFISSLLTIFVVYIFRLIRRPLLMARPKSLRFWGIPLLAFMLFGFGLQLLLSRLQLPDFGTTALFDEMRHIPLGFIALTLIGPLCEELIFREGILRLCLQKGIPAMGAIFISAFLFGVIHGNPVQAIPAFLLGVFLGYLYVRVGDIRLSYAAHILNNTVAIILLNYPQVDEHFNAMSAPHLYFVGGLLVFHGIIFTLFWRRLNKPKKDKPTLKAGA